MKENKMGNKILKSLFDPYLKISCIVLAIFSAVLLYYNLFVGIAAALITLALFIVLQKLSAQKSKDLADYTEAVAGQMDQVIRRFIARNPLPLCMVDSHDNILWFNDKFGAIFEKAEMFSSTLMQVAGLKVSDFAEIEKEEKLLRVNRNDRTYDVVLAPLDSREQGTHMLYWMDVTELSDLELLYEEEQPCCVYINVDNYDELLASAPDEKKGVIMSQIEKEIRQWAARNEASVVRSRSNQYFAVLEKRFLSRLVNGKFPILDEIRAIETDADFPTSLSIGIGTGSKSLMELEQYAMAALELALGRGGDQAVVKSEDRIDYYGGKLQSVEKRNKGKSRIMAHALRQLIDQSTGVLVMGHRMPDLDCFGSALGIYRIARNRNKEAAIVINEYGKALEEFYPAAVSTGQYRFVNSEEAKQLVDQGTLLVVVDVHRPALVECKELLHMTDKIVLLDHHRRAEDCIDHATLTYMESYASSTAELVVEIMQYVGDSKRPLEKLEAEALLAGIYIDTKAFSIKSGGRTFDAASWLKRMGADTTNVRHLLQVDMDSFQKRTDVVRRAELLPNGVALSSFDGMAKEMQLLASQAADELLNIRGVRASFVAGKNEKGIVVVSARSLGQVNVQTTMEKLGGGGHMTTAGAQVELPLEEVLEKLRALASEL
ncbi:MAG: DHH family phosphoesterase [Bacillota bacterium]|nr:DHH family phosphoesterase [Bacillota bacterium]